MEDWMGRAGLVGDGRCEMGTGHVRLLITPAVLVLPGASRQLLMADDESGGETISLTSTSCLLAGMEVRLDVGACMCVNPPPPSTPIHSGPSSTGLIVVYADCRPLLQLRWERYGSPSLPTTTTTPRKFVLRTQVPVWRPVGLGIHL